MTASRPDLYLPVDARGELHLEAPTGATLDLQAQGSVLRLYASGWDDIVSLTPTSLLSLRQLVRNAATALLATDLRFELLVDDKTAFAVGAGVKPGFLSRLLGLRATRFTLRRIPITRFFG